MTVRDTLKRHFAVSTTATAGAIAAALSEIPAQAEVTAINIEESIEMWAFGGPQRVASITAELTVEGEES